MAVFTFWSNRDKVYEALWGFLAWRHFYEGERVGNSVDRERGHIIQSSIFTNFLTIESFLNKTEDLLTITELSNDHHHA